MAAPITCKSDEETIVPSPSILPTVSPLALITFVLLEMVPIILWVKSSGMRSGSATPIIFPFSSTITPFSVTRPFVPNNVMDPSGLTRPIILPSASRI